MADSAMTASPKILLGVTGGIAAYKACELARLFGKAEAVVQVVMTEAAKRFVGAQSFQALTGRTVRDSLWDPAAEAAMGHIELARWPDAIVVAPASADFLARLAHGFADDLLSTLLLATDRPIFVVPAMNRLMWANAATQANVALLRNRGVVVIGPGSGAQACGEVGEGRMSEPPEICAQVLASFKDRALAQGGVLDGLRAVVTAGPTREPIDPVRFITNRSSGKQGYAVAAALRAFGAEVTLISGPVALAAPSGVQRIDVQSAQAMCEATLAALEGADLLVGAAAVADYRVVAAPQKIKKSGAPLNIKLLPNPDILVEARARFPQLFIVGFAAETEDLEAHAKGKLARKRLDLIAANWVGEGRAFDTEDNSLSVFWEGGERKLGPAAKAQVARELAVLIAERIALKP